jgi:1,4-alpha-glucan branching enzyme
MSLAESSWGMGGKHFTWDNVDTHWMWPIIHAAEARMEALVTQHQRAEGPLLDVLSQAARELLLLQSSDWPFQITAGHGAEYAVERFREHADRFDRLASIAESGVVDEDARRLVADLWERDKVFADVDYRDWAPRGGVSATGPARPRPTSSETSGSGYSSGAPSAAPDWAASGS